MGAIIAALMARGLSEKLARVISYAGLALLFLGASAGLLTAYNHHVIGVHERKIIARAAPATEQAAQERASDTIKQSTDEQEAHHDIARQSDQPIAPTSRALACKQLHDAGRNPAACRGLASGH